MKKLILAMLGLSLTATSFAQTNTFPSSGNVGIGTTSPASKLHVLGADNNGTNAALRVSSGTQNMFLDGNEIDSNGALYLNNNSANNLYLNNGGGKVGVGGASLVAKLNVKGVDNNGTTATLAVTSGTQTMLFDGNEIDANGTLYINNNTSNKLILNNGGGNVGISTSPDYKLDINGTARAKEIRVQTGWSDYVFFSDYQLPTLQEEEQHINANGHLLGFESEAAMEGEVQLGDVTKRQQAKIEEMMLHMIEMKKEIDLLKGLVKPRKLKKASH